MKRILCFSFTVLLGLSFCHNRSVQKTEGKLWERALKICRQNIILDSHIDWPEIHLLFPDDISGRIEYGDFDLVRANQGGLNAAMSVIYISDGYAAEDRRSMMDTMLGMVDYYVNTYPEKFAPAYLPSDIEKNFRNHLFSLPVALENGAPVGEDLTYLGYLKEKGIAYITLNHGKTNQISDSSYDPERKWNGLSPFGIEVIREMNRLGIMIDISHSTDSTVFQALRYSMAPIIASHSSCRIFTPGFERNLSDTLIKAIAGKNGVIMVNFGSLFLDTVCLKNCQYVMHWYDSSGYSMHTKEGIAFTKKYAETHTIKSDTKTVADHIDHIVSIAGIDYVGIGSDFNGIGMAQPVDLPDVSAYPALVVELLRRGYTESQLRKILSGNFLRVWNEVLEISEAWSTD